MQISTIGEAILAASYAYVTCLGNSGCCLTRQTPHPQCNINVSWCARVTAVTHIAQALLHCCLTWTVCTSSCLLRPGGCVHQQAVLLRKHTEFLVNSTIPSHARRLHFPCNRTCMSCWYYLQTHHRLAGTPDRLPSRGGSSARSSTRPWIGRDMAFTHAPPAEPVPRAARVA